jgi:hypothetical protein
MELKVCYCKLFPDGARLIRASCFEQQYMLEMVEARKNSDNVEQCHDLFNGLLDAAQDELDDGAAIGDDELICGYSISHRLNFWKLKHPWSQQTCSYFFLLDMR